MKATEAEKSMGLTEIAPKFFVLLLKQLSQESSRMRWYRIICEQC